MSDSPLGSRGNVDFASAAPPADSREAGQGKPDDLIDRLRDLADRHAQPAHDEEAYYNPPPRQDPWEGIGYFLLALTAGVAGWALWQWLGA